DAPPTSNKLETGMPPFCAFDNFANDSSGTTKYAQYTYLGSGTIVQVTHPAVTNGLTLTYGSGGTYGGFDRFGRIVDQQWTNGAGTSNLDRYQYAYDRAGNRIYRKARPSNNPTGQDESYGYDNLQRLIDFRRGGLSGNDVTVPDDGFSLEQRWDVLEALGDWRTFTWQVFDLSPDPSEPVTQSRTHNAANELTAISGTGADWIDPVYDAAGNMTKAPKPG